MRRGINVHRELRASHEMARRHLVAPRQIRIEQLDRGFATRASIALKSSVSPFTTSPCAPRPASQTLKRRG
jgi:hypothetical protein